MNARVTGSGQFSSVQFTCCVNKRLVFRVGVLGQMSAMTIFMGQVSGGLGDPDRLIRGRGNQLCCMADRSSPVRVTTHAREGANSSSLSARPGSSRSTTR